MTQILVILLIACIGFQVRASDPYRTYTYNYWGEPQLSPAGYTVEMILSGDTLGAGPFNNPQDIFIDSRGWLYIADMDNGRVIVCNEDYEVITILSELRFNGEVIPLYKPSGLFVTNEGQLMIVDSEQKIIYSASIEGEVSRIYQRPEGKIQFTAIDFLPQKVLVDSNRYVYVLCRNMFQGAMMYEEDGEFIGYFGANRTPATIETVFNSFFRRFMTSEQRARIFRQTPVAISNFDIDSNGFIYTCTSATIGLNVGTEQIRKLNPKGINVLPPSSAIMPRYQQAYGDLDAIWVGGRVDSTNIIDVSYDEKGLINALDESRGRVFQYDTESNLLFAFGGLGNQKGTFSRPVAIESDHDRILVLDSGKRNIVIFKNTHYASLVHNAIHLYNRGEYVEAEKYWNEVLVFNRNFNLSYVGLGKIRFEQQDYRGAMEYFRMAQDRENYGRAYKEYRNALLRSFIIQTLITGLVLAALLYGIRKLIIFRRGKNAKTRERSLGESGGQRV